jgi:cell wall-associated NlpC family hydrolase
MNKIDMTKTHRRNDYFSPLVRICMFAASLCLSSAVWSAEDLTSESNPTLATLQDLTNRASELAMRAMGMLGIRYKYGGTTPENGLDCSGLVRYVFKETWGADLPRTAVEISRVGQRVDPKDLQLGDLVFYNTMRRGFSHVGIYLGNNRFIHSPAGGGEVRIERMELHYWKRRFNGARRIDDPEQ